MTTDSMKAEDDAKLFLGETWSDPIEAGIRDRIRGFIEQLIEEELAAALGRGWYERRHHRGCGEAGSPDGLPAAATADDALDGHRHGHRQRRITGSFGTVEIAVPRARIGGAGGPGREWKSKALPPGALDGDLHSLVAEKYLDRDLHTFEIDLMPTAVRSADDCIAKDFPPFAIHSRLGLPLRQRGRDERRSRAPRQASQD